MSFSGLEAADTRERSSANCESARLRIERSLFPGGSSANAGEVERRLRTAARSRLLSDKEKIGESAFGREFCIQPKRISQFFVLATDLSTKVSRAPDGWLATKGVEFGEPRSRPLIGKEQQ